MHFIKLKGLARFFLIRFSAVPWSGETLKYFNPKVALIASNLKRSELDLKLGRDTCLL